MAAVRERTGQDLRCESCGKGFYKSPARVGLHNYCSRQCAGSALRNKLPVTCAHCGTVFYRVPAEIKFKNHYCSIDCFAAGKPAADAQLGKIPLSTKTCERCGREYQGLKQRKYCSVDCSNQALASFRAERGVRRLALLQLARWPEERPRKRRRPRRVNKRMKLAVCERDRWRCGICRKRVSRKLQWPHPRCAVVDHIIPVSPRGFLSAGNDDPANLRCTHNICNNRKRNGGGGEQLALIGGIELLTTIRSSRSRNVA